MLRSTSHDAASDVVVVVVGLSFSLFPFFPCLRCHAHSFPNFTQITHIFRYTEMVFGPKARPIHTFKGGGDDNGALRL